MSFNSTALDQFTNCSDASAETLIFVSNNIETPIYFCLGLFSRLISLASIYRESKTEQAYVFQIYVLLAEIAEISFESVSQLMQKLRLNDQWFQQCYTCMWWDAHFTSVFATVTKANTNILTLIMTADRAYCLVRPIKYANRRHTTVAKLRKWTPAMSIVISLAINAPSGFIYELDEHDDGFYVQFIARTSLAIAYGLVSGLFDLALIISNIVANILLCYGFREAMKNRAKIRRLSSMEEASNSTDDDRSKTLFKMTFCQSFCNTFASLISITHRVTAAVLGALLSPAFRLVYCFGGPVSTISTQLVDIIEFCLMMIVSRKFRKMVIGTLKRNACCEKVTKDNRVRTISVSEAQK